MCMCSSTITIKGLQLFNGHVHFMCVCVCIFSECACFPHSSELFIPTFLKAVPLINFFHHAEVYLMGATASHFTNSKGKRFGQEHFPPGTSPTQGRSGTSAASSPDPTSPRTDDTPFANAAKAAAIAETGFAVKLKGDYWGDSSDEEEDQNWTPRDTDEFQQRWNDLYVNTFLRPVLNVARDYLSREINISARSHPQLLQVCVVWWWANGQTKCCTSGAMPGDMCFDSLLTVMHC